MGPGGAEVAEMTSGIPVGYVRRSDRPTEQAAARHDAPICRGRDRHRRAGIRETRPLSTHHGPQDSGAGAVPWNIQQRNDDFIMGGHYSLHTGDYHLKYVPFNVSKSTRE